MGIFSKNRYPSSDLKRNTFDLSFQNNLTTNFGVIKPVFCKEVLPGDTFDIDTTMSFKFMPTVFPIQNRCRASIKYFYVRNRSLYDNYKEWSTGNDTKDGGLPYMSMTYGTSDSQFPSYEDLLRFLQLGGLADSFGIPVTVTYPTGANFYLNSSFYSASTTPIIYDSDSPLSSYYSYPSYSVPVTIDSYDPYGLTIDSFPEEKGVHYFSYRRDSGTELNSYPSLPSSLRLNADSVFLSFPSIGGSLISYPAGYLAQLKRLSGLTIKSKIEYFGLTYSDTDPFMVDLIDSEDSSPRLSDVRFSSTFSRAGLNVLRSNGWGIYPVLVGSDSSGAPSSNNLYSPRIYSIGEYDPSTGDATITIPNNFDWEDLPPTPFDPESPSMNTPTYPVFCILLAPPALRSSDDATKGYSVPVNIYRTIEDVVGSLDLADGDSIYRWSLASLPYSQSVPYYHVAMSSGKINFPTKISAMPFRAYEMIYNSFYRDERNNPFQIDGVSYYDKFLPTYSGGEDKTNYQLHRVNWEQDQFTTALPSPQQGAAPLVGITASGRAVLSDPDTGKLVSVQLQTAEDGDTVTNYDQTEDLSPAVHRTLINAATSGISINDFRNVNALQRYLEKNMRQGLRYKDMIQSRWGVSPSYSELNMPEFIGGCVEDIVPAIVNQQSQDTSDSPLGSYAGQLYCNGSSRHGVHKFCDEAGYIIGLLDLSPSPVYDSLLPKHLTKFELLDFFNPEFGHIGMQAIPTGELAFAQTLVNGGSITESGLSYSSLDYNTTFGYQRAWYDYLCSNDEVHGQFRTSLKDFCIHREFANLPTLSEEFLLVDDKDVNNIFSVQTDADGNEVDKVLGQVYFNVKAKRPIPRFGIPRLE